MRANLSRRRLLILGAGAALAAPILAACGQAAPTAAPTAAPASAKPTEAPKPAAEATKPAEAAKPAAAATTAPAATKPAEAAKPTEAPKAAAPATGGQQVTVRLSRFPGVGWEQDVMFVDEFQKKNPNIKVQAEDTPYGEMNKKILTQAATGTLADMFPGHTRWNGQIRGKGIMLDLDPLVKANAEITKFDDFFPSVIADARGPGADGKLFEFPTIVHPGGNAVVLINTDHADKAGVKVPDSITEWTVDDLEKIVRGAARPKDGIYGAQFTYSSPLYSTQITRSWGDAGTPQKSDPASWVLSPDGKKSQLGSPPVKQSFEWYGKMVKDGLTPTKDVAQPGSGLDFFTAGKLVANAREVGAVNANTKIIGDKFKWKAFLWPRGPKGHRGTCLSYNTWALYSKTKVPDEAYKLLVNQTSTEVGFWAAYEGSANPYARRSIWTNPDLWKKFPIFKEVSQVFEGGIDPFPMPANLLAQEYQDVFGQETDKYLDGKEDWNQMFGHADKAIQAVLDQPRPV
jgi:ABC-type glycerol-3-phosphate transport system substrate-binding protein